MMNEFFSIHHSAFRLSSWSKQILKIKYQIGLILEIISSLLQDTTP